MNTDLKPTHQNTGGAEGWPFAQNAGDAQAWGTIDEPTAFDILENPQLWPDDPIVRAELAELLEVHLALWAHSEYAAAALRPKKGPLQRSAAWLLPTAAAMLAVLPALHVMNRVRETKAMQARGAELEVEMQKRIQIELWSDFFKGSLELLKQVQGAAKQCGPFSQDRSSEIEQARRLYAFGRSLPLDGLDDPEAIDARRNLQNWLTEVSTNDACMTMERSHELLGLAKELGIEERASKLNQKLKGDYS